MTLKNMGTFNKYKHTKKILVKDQSFVTLTLLQNRHN